MQCREERRPLFEKKSYTVLECSSCKHRFVQVPDPATHVSDTYSDDYFFAGKDGYPNYLNEKELLYERGLRYAKLAAKFTAPGKVLDIGAAAGFILKGFRDSGWDCHGIEPNNTMAGYARTKLRIDVQTGNIEDFHSNEQFDLITLIQVIGHVYDPDKTLRNIQALLRSGGLVLVESWNMASLVARVMGKRWHEYSPPSVVHWFSDRTLQSLFEAYGMQLVDKGYPLKKLSAEHALSFLESKTSTPLLKNFVTSLNKTAGKLPLIYPLMDVKWYLFRKHP